MSEKEKISFHKINEEIGALKKAIRPVRIVVDGSGVVHSFFSHRGYMEYLESRDLVNV